LTNLADDQYWLFGRDRHAVGILRRNVDFYESRKPRQTACENDILHAS
jgi:hypothetical protein